MAEYGELKNLQAFLNYWNFTADKFEQQNDIYGRLTGAIIRDWVYDYTKEGDFLVENGDLDWLVKGSASDDQKLAAFDQWLGHNTANPAIVPAIQDYLVEHRQEIDQEVQDHQLTLDNVTDDSAERYMEVLEKINDQKAPNPELMLGWAGSYAIKQDGEWQIHGTHAALEELEADQVGYKFAGDLRDAPDDAPVHATPDILLAPEEMSVTTKQELLESAQEVLRNNDLPDTKYNCYSMAETILEATEWTHTGISAEEVSIDLRENPKNYNLDGMAERDAVDKYNERFAKLASHYGLLAAPYDEKTNYYTREVKTYLWLKDKSLRETDDRIIVADFDEIMNADVNDTLDRLAMKKMAKQYLNYLHHAYPNYENAPAGISNSLSMLRDMSDYLYYEQRTPRYTPRQLQSMVRQGLEELKRQEERTQEIIYHDERVEAVKKLTLTDDASDRGGKAYADETAGDFMQTAFGNRADVDFKELNQALKESGIKPLAEPLAQQKIERAAKVLAKNYAQDQTSMAVAEYLQNTKRPMAQRLKVANNIIAARRPHGKPISNSKKQTKEH